MQEEKTQLTGLSKETAQTRLNENGPNELAQAEKKSMLARFLDQFKDFMIIVLLAAALIAGFLLSEWADAGIIRGRLIERGFRCSKKARLKRPLMRLKKCPLLTRMFVGVIKYSRSLAASWF